MVYFKFFALEIKDLVFMVELVLIYRECEGFPEKKPYILAECSFLSALR